MIRQIRLTNWRAWESLELDLTRPVTFFVAPNGVGKTSLVEAVRWCLLGTPDERDRSRAVRANKSSATVNLVVRLSDGADLDITRVLKRSGATTFSATIRGEAISEDDYRRITSDAWSANTTLLDTLMFGPSIASKSGAFPIRDHLANIFGITQLLDSATTIKTRRNALAEHVKSLRADISATDDAIRSAEQNLLSLTAAIETARAHRDDAVAAVRDAELNATLADTWQQYRSDAAEYSKQTAILVAEISDVLEVGDSDPRLAAEAGESEATTELDATIAANTEAQLRLAAAASASELLADNPDHCPTCLRSLSASERDEALAAHGHADSDARTEIKRHEEETEAARQRLAAISRFARSMNDLRRPVEPSDADPGPEATRLLDESRQRLNEATEGLGALTSQLRSAEENLSAMRQAASQQVELVSAEREDMVLGITEKSLNTMATRHMTERIEPLVDEIRNRWKLVFGSDGLRFDADGFLKMNHGDADVALRDFSGGERSTALLVTRLLLAASTTHASTMWFDEPLEHLDPRRRAAVAQTIVRAAQTGAVTQIVVTTYEEGLARRLAMTAPDDVELMYARKSPTAELLH